jgi:hypothetical protein
MTTFNLRRIYFALASCAALLVLIAVSLSPAYAAEIPSDDEQDVLIRSTLSTFNDANMTGNYSVLLAKASKEFQGQFSPEKLAAGFEVFRKKEGFFEEVVTAEYDSEEKAKFVDGALVLAGVFNLDNMKLTYRLSFLQNAKVWKWSSINVDIDKK